MPDPSITSSLLNQPTADTNARKGIKGYQPKKVTASVNMAFRVTPQQAEAIKKACKEKDVTISQLVRAGLECYLSDYEEHDGIDLNQLSIWSE